MHGGGDSILLLPSMAFWDLLDRTDLCSCATLWLRQEQGELGTIPLGRQTLPTPVPDRQTCRRLADKTTVQAPLPVTPCETLLQADTMPFYYKVSENCCLLQAEKAGTCPLPSGQAATSIASIPLLCQDRKEKATLQL